MNEMGKGSVYAVEFWNVVKIGLTTDFNERVKSLKSTFHYRNEKKKMGRTFCSKEMYFANRAECWLHDKFKDKRIDHTELFRITFEDAEKAIKEVEQLKLYSDEDWNHYLEREKESNAMFEKIFYEKSEEAKEKFKEAKEESMKLNNELVEAYQEQIKLLKESRWQMVRMLVGLCDDEDYRDWLLNNPKFIESIKKDYAKMLTDKLTPCLSSWRGST